MLILVRSPDPTSFEHPLNTVCSNAVISHSSEIASQADVSVDTNKRSDVFVLDEHKVCQSVDAALIQPIAMPRLNATCLLAQSFSQQEKRLDTKAASSPELVIQDIDEPSPSKLVNFSHSAISHSALPGTPHNAIAEPRQPTPPLPKMMQRPESRSVPTRCLRREPVRANHEILPEAPQKPKSRTARDYHRPGSTRVFTRSISMQELPTSRRSSISTPTYMHSTAAVQQRRASNPVRTRCRFLSMYLIYLTI